MTPCRGPNASLSSQDATWAKAVRRLQWHLYLRDIEPAREALVAHCRALTRRDAEAQDLAQETLLRGFNVVAQLCRGPDKPLPFLRRIANNLWIDWQRRDRRVRTGEAQEPRDAGPDASQLQELEESLTLLAAVLPPREEEVFVLRELLGYTGPEVASLLGTSPAAAKMAASRARRRLKRRTWDRN